MKNYLLFVIILTGLTTSIFAQNVGVGVIAPTRAKFEVQGAAGAGATSGIFGGESTGISLQRNWPTIGFNQYRDLVTPGSQGKYIANGFAAIQYLSPVNGTMVFDMFGFGTGGNSTPAAISSLLLFSTGNVGIKSAANDATLHVARGTATSTAVFDGTTYSSMFNNNSLEYTYIRAGLVGGRVFINDIPQSIVSIGLSDGTVGINAGTPVATLDIHQTEIGGFEKGLSLRNLANDRWELYNGGRLFFKLNTIAKSFVDEDGSYHTTSDRRLKRNINAMPDVLNEVCQLHPVTYNFTNESDNEKPQYGLVAQELEKIFPDLVDILPRENTGSEYSDLRMVNYSALGSIAIKAIQEQQKMIEDLQKEIKALKKKNHKRNK